ncbi:hypothetical protein JCM11251_006286 [Rhodosporidiobolus azoricus]
MSSSSDLEIVTRAPAKTASPPKPRRTGRSRRAPRSVDLPAASAAPRATKKGRKPSVNRLNDDEEEVMELSGMSDIEANEASAPPTTKQREQPVASTSQAVISDREIVESTLTASSATLASRSSDPSLPSTRLSPARAASTSLPRACSASNSLPPLSKKPSSNSSVNSGVKRPRSRTPGETSFAPPRKIERKPFVKGDSSDEADDFFSKKPAAFKGRVPGGGAKKVPGGGGGGGRKPGMGRTSAPPAASPGKGKAKATLPNDDSSEDEYDRAQRGAAATSASFGAPIPSSTENSTDDDSSLPSSTPDSSAAKKKQRGRPANDGVKHVNLPAWARASGSGSGGGNFAPAGQSGADKAKAARGFKANRKKKRMSDSESEGEEMAMNGGGGGMFDGVAKEEEFREDEDTDDSLEIALGGTTPKTAGGKGKGRVPSRGMNGDTPRATSPNKSRSIASPARASPRKPSTSTHPSLGKSNITLSSDLSDGDSNDRPEKQSKTGEKSDDDVLSSIYANIRRLKEPTRTSATATASPAPGGAGEGASSSPRRSAPVRGEGGMVTFVLRMVFDPTRQVPEIAKRRFEQEERFEVAVDDSFESLFYDLSVRRTIPRENLIITYSPLFSSSVSSSSTLSTPTSAALPPALPSLTVTQTQVYDLGTPSSLSLRAREIAHLRGYTRDVWEKVKQLQRERRANPAAEEDEVEKAAAAAAAAAALARARSPSAAPSAAGAGGSDDEAPAAGGGGGDLFPLTLRSSKTHSLSLAVKPFTTMSQLVKAYCKKHSGMDPAKTWLEFEGDRLDGGRTVEDVKDEFDLEGEETFEVRTEA